MSSEQQQCELPPSMEVPTFSPRITGGNKENYLVVKQQLYDSGHSRSSYGSTTSSNVSAMRISMTGDIELITEDEIYQVPLTDSNSSSSHCTSNNNNNNNNNDANNNANNSGKPHRISNPSDDATTTTVATTSTKSLTSYTATRAVGASNPGILRCSNNVANNKKKEEDSDNSSPPNAETTVLDNVNEQEEEERKTLVRFSTLTIAEYPRIVGVNPGGTMGVPITMAWECLGEQIIPIDDYEAFFEPQQKQPSSPPSTTTSTTAEEQKEGVETSTTATTTTALATRRTMVQMKMTSKKRMIMMKNLGFTMNEIQYGIKHANIARNRRKRTNELLHLEKIQFFLERFFRAIANLTWRRQQKRKERAWLEEYCAIYKHDGNGNNNNKDYDKRNDTDKETDYDDANSAH